ncbi:arsenate reductase family protein [Frisingicoccus sp.]|uniref:arsenate reductase family protein n=1 Tax=Frisingicoccus sp. TaxID=1918627 RepID=UPI003AB208C7
MLLFSRRKKMNRLFVEYPKCSTCRKAKKYLEEHQVDFEDRHIVENNPTEEELKDWIARSGLPVKKFFNTSGKKYKDMELKNKLPEMSEEEQIALLASDGMLVKRPIVVEDNRVLVGFKEAEWAFEN